MKKYSISLLGVSAVLCSFLLVGCGGGGGTTTATTDSTVVSYPVPVTMSLLGTVVACDGGDAGISTDAGDFNASQPVKRNISSTSDEDVNRKNSNSHNTISSLSVISQARSANGDLVDDGNISYHPLLVNYIQQIVGDYEMGDGSADIGDPTHVDGVFVGVSLDNGATWKNFTISDSTSKSSMDVVWDIDKTATKIPYPGNAQKNNMATWGNRILIAWNDKYCPSGNPLELPKDADGKYYTDFFAVNGSQGSIDYAEAQDGSREIMIAPNGKEVYEVPFSCVWTARGIFNPDDGTILWHAPKQLTTGTRDSNHIWIAGSDVGFAISWQEDTEGLRSGKGEGPGEGWSGATTNHGSDIWYSSLKMTNFDDVNGTDENTTKPKSLYNFTYPVRVTDNEICSNEDTKIYCQNLCATYGYVTLDTGNNQEGTITRCKTGYIDMLNDTQVALDGDTGASRSALSILETDLNEYVVILGYEETKGLSDGNSGDQGTVEVDIALEGKVVLFESFKFDALDDFNISDPSTIQTVAMPLVSSSKIVNIKVPAQDNPTNMIYENARRLVIGTQIDPCDTDRFTFAFLYKQSFDVQGASSDMFVRVNNGFTYDTFIPLDGRVVTNVSAQANQVVETPADYIVMWSEENLDDNTYENSLENTFSPRIFLRGNNIMTGFAYTPNDAKTTQGNMPSNFHIHRYIDGVWQGPQNITKVIKGTETTVDARFFGTSEGAYEATGLESDKSNPNVLFVTWGNIDVIDPSDPTSERTEGDLFFTRSADNGITWDEIAKLAARDGSIIEEKEVESYASPDGKTVYNVWIQEQAEDNVSNDPFSGLDSWFGRIDYNISN
ncbi:MAG: hypothetical protein J0647_10520 [Campylobacteraceae bacterium]|nr:hypothetical protein [Campylobacteraceae bacterium]